MILILLSLTLWIYAIIFFQKNPITNNKVICNAIIIVFGIYVSVLLAISENNISDMTIYIKRINIYENINLFEAFSIANSEKLFTAFQWAVSKITTSPPFFYVLVWVIFMFFLIKALKNIFEPWQSVILFFCFLNFFEFFGYINNGVRQGIAISIIIYNVSFILNKSKFNQTRFYLLLILAPMFHASALPISIILFIIQRKVISNKFIYFLLMISLFLYITNINSLIFERLAFIIEDIDIYTSESTIEAYNNKVNRLDFLIFNMIWVIYGFIMKGNLGDAKLSYHILLNIYILFNVYFLLFGFIAYSNRIAAYSWFLIPIIIMYPLLKGEKYNPILVSLIVFGFTLSALISKSFLYFPGIIK